MSKSDENSSKYIGCSDGWCGWCGAVFCDRPETDEYANCDECGKPLGENPPDGSVEPKETMNTLIGYLDGVVEAIGDAVEPNEESPRRSI